MLNWNQQPFSNPILFNFQEGILMKPLTYCSLFLCLVAATILAVRVSPAVFAGDEAPPPPDTERSDADDATEDEVDDVLVSDVAVALDFAGDDSDDEAEEREERSARDQDDDDSDEFDDDERDEAERQERREFQDDSRDFDRDEEDRDERRGDRRLVPERRRRIVTDSDGRVREEEFIEYVDPDAEHGEDAFDPTGAAPSQATPSVIESRVVRDRNGDYRVERRIVNARDARADEWKPKPRTAALQRLQQVREKIARGDRSEQQLERLREALNNYFEQDLQVREQQLEEIRSKLQAMEEKLEQRRRSQKEVVDLQYRLLVNEANGLGFFAPGDSAQRRPASGNPFSPTPRDASDPFGEPLAPMTFEDAKVLPRNGKKIRLDLPPERPADVSESIPGVPRLEPTTDPNRRR
ncbi:MAG: hypothetical protein Fues2KO_48300 [Fuerstiella sp.]